MRGAVEAAVPPPQQGREHSPAERVASLVARARDGDADAFATLVRIYDDVVLRVTRAIVRDLPDAEDMRQEVWLRVAEHLSAINEPTRFGAWVRTIARNVSLNLLRMRSLARSSSSALLEDELVTVDGDGAKGPDQDLLRRDDQREMWEALGELSEEDRLMLRLREVEDRSYAEIAARLHLTAHAAEMRTHRARARLRRRLADMARATRPWHVSPLQLSALLDRSGSTPFHVHDHVSACARCERQLATLRAGQSVFSGLGALLVFPRALSFLESKLRAVAAGVRGPATALPSFAQNSIVEPLSSLTTASGVAVAAAVFAVSTALAAIPSDAHDSMTDDADAGLVAPSIASVATDVPAAARSATADVVVDAAAGGGVRASADTTARGEVPDTTDGDTTGPTAIDVPAADPRPSPPRSPRPIPRPSGHPDPSPPPQRQAAAAATTKNKMPAASGPSNAAGTRPTVHAASASTPVPAAGVQTHGASEKGAGAPSAADASHDGDRSGEKSAASPKPDIAEVKRAAPRR